MRLKSGKRVLLRDLAEEDVDHWAHWMMPGHRWRELDGPYYQQEPTEQWVRETAEKMRARLRADASLPAVRERAVIASIETDGLIGQVSRYWISEETNWLAIGIVIYDPANWGHGLGHEALGLWTEYLFESELDLVRLDMRTWSGNRAMARLAEKLGYVQEACFRNARKVADRYYDGLGFGVLREEWEGRYPDGFKATP